MCVADAVHWSSYVSQAYPAEAAPVPWGVWGPPSRLIACNAYRVDAYDPTVGTHGGFRQGRGFRHPMAHPDIERAANGPGPRTVRLLRQPDPRAGVMSTFPQMLLSGLWGC